MNYLTDTHALIWYFAQDKHIGKKAEKIFYRAENGIETIILPTIVVVEGKSIARKKKYANKYKKTNCSVV
jgi:PIN domain nuclease of toxin-antitoxin system